MTGSCALNSDARSAMRSIAARMAAPEKLSSASSRAPASAISVLGQRMPTAPPRRRLTSSYTGRPRCGACASGSATSHAAHKRCSSSCGDVADSRRPSPMTPSKATRAISSPSTHACSRGGASSSPWGTNNTGGVPGSTQGPTRLGTAIRRNESTP